jgi:hypothetical protein
MTTSTRRVAQRDWKAIVRALQSSIPTAALDDQMRAAFLHLICLCAVTFQREEFHEQLLHRSSRTTGIISCSARTETLRLRG